MHSLFVLIITFLSITLIHAQELEVVNVAQTTCDHRIDISRIQPRIISKSIRNDTVLISIGTIANCAGIYDVSAFFKEDTLFIKYLHGKLSIDTVYKNQIETIYSFATYDKRSIDTIITNNKVENILELVEIASCSCCFEFNFTIAGLFHEPCYVNVNNSELKYHPNKCKILPFMFRTIDGDTINKIDENGKKQGKWDTFYADRKLDYLRYSKNFKFSAYYVNDYANTAEVTWLYPNGKPMQKVVFHNYKVYKTEKYNKKGKLIRNKKALTNESNGFIR